MKTTDSPSKTKFTRRKFVKIAGTRYGTKYAYRAAWTFFGIGGNVLDDALYPMAQVDADCRHALQTRASLGYLLFIRIHQIS